MHLRQFAGFLLFIGLAYPLAMAESVMSEDVPVELTEELSAIMPSIKAVSAVEVNKSIIFDGSGSVANTENLTYKWQLGDGNHQEGVEVVHSFAEPGEYQVILSITDNNGNSAEIQHSVFVFKRAAVLITNVVEDKERVDRFVEAARLEGILVQVTETYTTQSEFLEEEALKRQLLEHISDLEPAETIIIYTSGSAGLTVLSQLNHSVSEPDLFKGKQIFFISDSSFSTLTNIARGVYESTLPSSILLTRSEALWVFLETETMDQFTQVLEERGIGYSVVNEKLGVRPWNFLSFLVNGMIHSGMSSSAILLILMLPIIVTVVAFMKQVVGLDTLGVYTPSILALSFIAMDLWFGLLIFLAILIIGMLIRSFLSRYRLLYIPRMAIVLTFVALTILLLLYFAALFKVGNVATVAIFPMLIMSTMVEKFVTIQTDKGLKSTVRIGLEVIFVAILCYWVAEWSFLKVLVLGHPEILLLFLVVNVILARWSGLRLTEYIRFREIIRHIEE